MVQWPRWVNKQRSCDFLRCLSCFLLLSLTVYVLKIVLKRSIRLSNVSPILRILKFLHLIASRDKILLYENVT